MISQDEIVSNAKTVTKGLEALRQEHESILCGIKSSLEQTGDLGAENSLIQAGVTDPDPGLFAGYGTFRRIRDFLTDPGFFAGSGTSCRTRGFRPDPEIFAGSGTFCHIRDFLPDPGLFAGPGPFSGSCSELLSFRNYTQDICPRAEI